jgi:hypothetical protein
MFRHPQIFISRSLNPWDMRIGIVGLIISYIKGQEIYTKFKVRYKNKATPCSTTPLGEET